MSSPQEKDSPQSSECPSRRPVQHWQQRNSPARQTQAARPRKRRPPLWRWAAALLTWQPAGQPRPPWDQNSSECFALSDLPAGHPARNLKTVMCLSPGEDCKGKVMTGLLATQNSFLCHVTAWTVTGSKIRPDETRTVGGPCLEHAPSMYEAGGWRQPALRDR